MRALPLLALISLLAACGGSAPDSDAVRLAPVETFVWTGDQPISFAPPPGSWTRSRYQNGGAEGVDFVLPGSGGEQIYVAERFFLGRRDHCSRLQEMLRQLENYDRRGFISALHEIRFDEKNFLNDGEARAAQLGNAALDRAQQSFGDESRLFTQIELQSALEQARSIRYTIDESVGRVLFTAERNGVYPALQVDEPVRGELAGRESRRVAFTFKGHGVPMLGSRVYVVANNRLFEFGYQGREPNLALFERLLETVEFPPGPCEH